MRDTGHGIPKSELPRVFERFHQADATTTREQEGTGIGLSLLKELVELHGGSVVVQSEEGFGTEFRVTLPIRPTQDGAEATAADGGEDEPPAGSASLATLEAAALKVEEAAPGEEAASSAEDGPPGPTVLVVEDNPDMRRYVRASLEGRGFSVLEAANGQEGLQRARRVLPDLIISDVMMPLMDGNALLEAIRGDAATRQIPFILLTAKADDHLRLAGIEGGADDFLSKPFDPGLLVARARNLIRMRELVEEVHVARRRLGEAALRRYLAPQLVERFLSGEIAIEEEPKAVSATILFSDPCGFTRLAARLRAARMARILNEYLGAMTEVVFEHGGTIDKFVGDAIIVIFGAPEELPPGEQVERACACALAMQSAVADLAPGWLEAGVPALTMRIGLHHGPVVVGSFGSARRSDYTAIGPTVNLASRIESACEPGRVFVSGEVADFLAEKRVEEAGSFELKGLPGTTPLFRLVDG